MTTKRLALIVVVTLGVMALIAVVTFVTMLGVVAMLPPDPNIFKANFTRAQVNGQLTRECQDFRLKHGRLPKTLAELLENNAVGGPFPLTPDDLIDQWGRPYQYDPEGPHNKGAKPDIWTVTPDGIEIGNWPTVK
jgi:hypothetical protein